MYLRYFSPVKCKICCCFDSWVPSGRPSGQFQLAREQIQTKLKTLQMKRQRILDAYFEGVISRSERDSRIAKVDLDRTALEAILATDRPRPELTLDTLVSAFAPFTEFDLLSRDDKRRLLNMLMPQITVLKYEVRGMSLCLNTIHGHGDCTEKIFTNTFRAKPD